MQVPWSRKLSKAAPDSGRVPELSQSRKALDENTIKIITDQPFSKVVLDFGNYGDKLAEIIKQSPPRFSIGIFGGWGTGKTTLMMTIEKKLEDNPNILSVWIDAWRYEREKYLAVIPFMRQIRIKLDNEFRKNKKTGRWNDVRIGLKRTFNAFVESSELTAGFGDGKAATVSVKTNLGKFKDSLLSNGWIWTNDKKVQFHEHATDYLAHALKQLRLENDKARIVVFIDDLDRCTPKKGLEILESIKSFFDIEGIVYVIGMNYNSIDFLIKEKYGQNPSITGFDYMKKIVQLPFSIPEWNEEDISRFIESITSTELKGSKIAGELSTKTNLLVRTIEWNPREVKRFINHIILVKAVFNKDVDKLIVVQALKFRPEWNKFLDFIIPNERRIKFFTDYIKRYKDSKAVNKKPVIKYKKALLQAYPSFFNQNDPLRNFLDAGAADIFLSITNMEDYRRAIDASIDALTSSLDAKTASLIQKALDVLPQVAEAAAKFSYI